MAEKDEWKYTINSSCDVLTCTTTPEKRVFFPAEYSHLCTLILKSLCSSPEAWICVFVFCLCRTMLESIKTAKARTWKSRKFRDLGCTQNFKSTAAPCAHAVWPLLMPCPHIIFPRRGLFHLMCTMDNAQDIPSGSDLVFLWNCNSVFCKLFSMLLKNLEACD